METGFGTPIMRFNALAALAASPCAVRPLQHGGQRHQGDIHLSLDRRKDGVSVDLDPPRPMVTALALARGGARGTPSPHPANGRHRCNAKAIGRSAP